MMRKRAVPVRDLPNDAGDEVLTVPGVASELRFTRAYVSEAVRHRDLRGYTPTSYKQTLDRYILPVLERGKVRALHRGMLEDLLAQRRAQGLSKNTVRLVRSVGSVLLGDAVDDGIIAMNPAPRWGAGAASGPTPSPRLSG